MLEESNRARDRYQADYLAVRGETLKLQAQLEYIRSGQGGNGYDMLNTFFADRIADSYRIETAVALKQVIDEMTEERDQWSRSGREDKTRLKALEKDLAKALANRKLTRTRFDGAKS